MWTWGVVGFMRGTRNWNDGWVFSPSLPSHMKIMGKHNLERVSWDFSVEKALVSRNRLPCCPPLSVHCWHGSFSSKTKLSIVYIHFISLLAFFIFQRTIYGKKIQFPINNQRDHILEGGKKIIVGNFCKKKNGLCLTLSQHDIFFPSNKSSGLFLHPNYSEPRGIPKSSGTVSPSPLGLQKCHELFSGFGQPRIREETD